MVIFAIDDTLEAADGFFERHVFAGRAGEDFGDEEGLGEEALDFARAVHHLFVFFGEFVHAEDGDDVAQFFVALQHALYAAGGFVVFVANNERVKLARGGVKRVNGRIDTELGNLARQDDGGIQVGEGGRR